MKFIGILFRALLVLLALYCLADGSTLDAIAVLLFIIILQLARLPYPAAAGPVERRAYTGPNNPLR